jgi:hypothetical protein
MQSRDLLRQQLAEQPLDAIVDKMLALEEQLRQREEELAAARAFIAELKRQLFGSKVEKLTPEQAAQVQERDDRGQTDDNCSNLLQHPDEKHSITKNATCCEKPGFAGL